MLEVAPGDAVRCYKTGDKGRLDEDGMLYCFGRFDFQVKLNGFRVELGDVECGLDSLPSVEASVVLPAERNGKVTHLVAQVVLADPEATPPTFATGRAIKDDVRKVLPEYMVPRNVVFHESFPLTTNGKVDRKAIAHG